jgi:hypothetical protein
VLLDESTVVELKTKVGCTVSVTFGPSEFGFLCYRLVGICRILEKCAASSTTLKMETGGSPKCWYLSKLYSITSH